MHDVDNVADLDEEQNETRNRFTDLAQTRGFDSIVARIRRRRSRQ